MKQSSYYPTLTPRFVANALGLSLKEALRPDPYVEVITDSRKVKPGVLFVAIPGEKFDGHDFISQAVQAGAIGIICRRDFELDQSLLGRAQFFRVEESVSAFRRLATAWRKEFTIPVIAVAGSVGKTTTKELLTSILKGKWPQVLKTQGSQNGFVGIPMTLLELRPEHQAAVIEVGIDEIGAMIQHTQVVAANAAILTAIGPEHLEKLQDVPTVAREEGICLTEVAKAGGSVMINLDDPWIRPLASSIREPKKYFFTLKGAAAPSGQQNLLSGGLDSSGKKLVLSGLGLDKTSVELPLPGIHNAGNLLGAITVARALGLTAEEIKKGLMTFQGADGRSEVKALKDGSPVLCDYYNANPTSVEAALQVVTELARGKTRWACLGDMLELGTDEEKFHRGLSESIQRLGIENVLLYGPRMKALQDELKNRGFKGFVAHFESHEALAGALSSRRSKGDAILIKGSRGMKMETVWKSITNQDTKPAQVELNKDS